MPYKLARTQCETKRMVKKINSQAITSLLIIIIPLILLTRPVFAQQVATYVLDEVTIDQTDYNAVVKVFFKQPVRYISHSPANNGKTINVQISLLRPFNPRISESLENESITPKSSIGLDEVVFEKNGINASFLLFYFDKSVSYKVIQGSDQRSLSVVIFGLE